MTLTNPLFASDARIGRAANNAPAMRRGEPDRAAVRILQNALVGVSAATMRRSIRPDGTLDGDYGGETVAGVRRFQQSVGLTGTNGRGDGIAGRATFDALDPVAPEGWVTLNLTPGPNVTPPAETSGTARAGGTVTPPTATAMLREYRAFRDVNGKPCQRDITNQCAIRMSVALMRSDIGFHFNGTIEYTHRAGSRACGLDVPHNAGAQRLFDHLRTIWTFTRYSKTGRNALTATGIRDAVAGRPGLVFFKNCFTRRGQSRKVGDHIDYWDGTHTMNDLLNYHGPGERDPGEARDWAHFFRKADREVWFLPVASG